MLFRSEKEALAEAYADMAGTEKSVDREIDKALNDPTIKAADSLAELKRKMGIGTNTAEKIEIKDKQEVTIKIEVDKNNN